MGGGSKQIMEIQYQENLMSLKQAGIHKVFAGVLPAWLVLFRAPRVYDNNVVLFRAPRVYDNHIEIRLFKKTLKN